MVVNIAPRPGYHIGCPRQALVAIENGALPPAVHLANVDPNGGGTAEDRKLADAEMADHKEFKKGKLKDLARKK